MKHYQRRNIEIYYIMRRLPLLFDFCAIHFNIHLIIHTSSSYWIHCYSDDVGFARVGRLDLISSLIPCYMNEYV
jgi:hypothetical protein